MLNACIWNKLKQKYMKSINNFFSETQSAVVNKNRYTFLGIEWAESWSNTCYAISFNISVSINSRIARF